MQWEHFTDGKQIPVCRSLSVYKRRGRRGNAVLFFNTLRGNWGFHRITGSAHCNSVAHRWQCKRGDFPMAIKLLIAVKWFFAWNDGERETPPSCASISGYNTLLQVRNCRLNRVTRFLTTGILTFPGGREANYGVLLADISSLPSVLSIPPGRVILG